MKTKQNINVLFFSSLRYLFQLLFCFCFVQTIQAATGEFDTNEPEKESRRIYGPLYLPSEDPDGNIFPQNMSELETRLNELVPDMVYKVMDAKSSEETLYLMLENNDSINRAFFALKEIYPDNIACDTEMLLRSYSFGKIDLSLSELHEFLVTRSTVADDVFIPTSHPYFQQFEKLQSRVGEQQKNNMQLTLDQILPEIGEQAIITIIDHTGVIKRTGADTYESSTWNGEQGIISTSFIYNNNEVFNHESWGNMDIEFYTKLSSRVPETQKGIFHRVCAPLRCIKKVLRQGCEKCFEHLSSPVDTIETPQA